MTARLTQPFILSRSIKWVPGIPSLLLCSLLNSIHKKVPSSFFKLSFLLEVTILKTFLKNSTNKLGTNNLFQKQYLRTAKISVLKKKRSIFLQYWCKYFYVKEVLSKLQNVIFRWKKYFGSYEKFPAPCLQLLDQKLSLKWCE